MHIITSISSYLQTNDEKEIKHYRSTSDRAAWALDFTGVDDKRGVAWSIRSRHNGRYLCAYGDDDSRANVNRDLADTWEHFTIVPV
eukprot:m51a1_g1049 hypothetical protein (86) ;mRNA; r:756802-757252